MDESKLEVYDLFEVSKMLKVSRVTLLKYVKAKKIKAFKIGKQLAIRTCGYSRIHKQEL